MRKTLFPYLSALLIFTFLSLPLSAQAPAPVAAPAQAETETDTPPPPVKSTRIDAQQVLQMMQGQNDQISQLNAKLNDQSDQIKKLSSDLKQAKTQTSGQLQDLQKDTVGKINTAVTTSAAAPSNLNIVWTLITGYLVMFMQAGFAMVETGFTRTKNVAHTMMMNFMVYTIAMLGFWICGFAIQFGGTASPDSVSAVTTLGSGVGKVLNSELGFHIGNQFWGIAGASGYCLTGAALDGGIFTLFLFQMVFMDTAATIPTGAMAERWKFLAFCIFSFAVGTFIYPIYGNWVWGGGWLAALGKNFGLSHGHVDFAGSSVVHMVGGVMALVGAWFLGPRIGKYNTDGTPNPIPGHNLPMAVIGTFILAFGWFGFNPGSTLEGNNPQIGIIATNTMLASAGGAVAAMIISWVRIGKPDPGLSCNGMLAGLVAITAPCAFVDAWAAVTLGALAGLLMYCSVFFVEEVLRIDDPVGAISVHGACGAWGVISLGIFANGHYGEGWNAVPGCVTGLLYGDWKQLVCECIGVATNVVFVGLATLVVLTLIETLFGNRVSAEAEKQGLDIPEMGAVGYTND